jgi:hypothetical protein
VIDEPHLVIRVGEVDETELWRTMVTRRSPSPRSCSWEPAFSAPVAIKLTLRASAFAKPLASFRQTQPMFSEPLLLADSEGEALETIETRDE